MAPSGAELSYVREAPVGPINRAVIISDWPKTDVNTHRKLMQNRDGNLEMTHRPLSRCYLSVHRRYQGLKELIAYVTDRVLPHLTFICQSISGTPSVLRSTIFYTRGDIELYSLTQNGHFVQNISAAWGC